MKHKKLDTIFSYYIRCRDKWTCRRCGTKYPIGNARALDASHYMGRTNASTRWEEDNLHSLCRGCHGYFEDRKQTEYRDWMFSEYGEERTREIEQLSRQIKKWTPKEKEALYKEIRKKIEDLGEIIPSRL